MSTAVASAVSCLQCSVPNSAVSGVTVLPKYTELFICTRKFEEILAVGHTKKSDGVSEYDFGDPDTAPHCCMSAADVAPTYLQIYETRYPYKYKTQLRSYSFLEFPASCRLS